MLRRFAVLAFALLMVGPAARARADTVGSEFTGTVGSHSTRASGSVFVDADRDGLRGPTETGLANVVVASGPHLARTDARGDYVLPAPAAGEFVRVTRPRGTDCDPWYRRELGDFPCHERPEPDEAFFVHVSDAHVFRDPLDFQRHSMVIPGWLPDWLSSRLVLWRLSYIYHDLSRDELVHRIETAIVESGGTVDGPVLEALMAEFARPGSRMGQVESHVTAAFDELPALEPDFVVSTGDLILEGNNAPPDVATRWMDFYLERVAATGLPWYHTIGNNELVGTRDRRIWSTHPDYGKGLYHRRLGPTLYSFDRGAYHFTALDTHREGRGGWNFHMLRGDAADWARADFAAHPDAIRVALNHEPFYWPPEAPGDVTTVFETDFLSEQGVDYALTGHLHRNGVSVKGSTVHISTGALSGMRWVLPVSVHPRGYRLVQTHAGRLLSAWKPLGEPAVGFVAPDPSPALFASGAERAAPGEIIAFAVDAAGPFEKIGLSADGEPLVAESLGRYFVRAQRPEGARRLELVARRADGSEERVAVESKAREVGDMP